MVYHEMMTTATPTRTSIGEGADLDTVFRALGDPTRRAIISRLTHGEATVSQIADQFDMSLPGVSKHLGVLEHAGLITRWRTGKSRRCRLEVNRMKTANAWIADQTRFWADTLDALAAFVETESTTP
jgi:DNA-binding transcriptional ArsR family regulator